MPLVSITHRGFNHVMAVKNPQTWTRLKRIELRQLANQIGNDAVRLMTAWPASGEGRQVKAAAEAIARRLDGQQSLGDIRRAFAEIEAAAADFSAILNNPFFQERLRTATYKVGGQQHLMNMGEEIESALEDIRIYTHAYWEAQPPPPTPLQIAAAEVTKLVPDQKVGPIMYEVAGGILRVRHQAAVSASVNMQNADSARKELLSSFGEIVTEMTSSNQDPRLIELTNAMRGRIEERTDIIQLGIAAISFQFTCDRFEEELPTHLSGRLRGLTIGLGMYVSQFSDWARFAGNAAAIDYSEADVIALHQSGMRLIQELRKATTNVDPEVPRTLAFILETIRDPRRALKRTVFAAIRSIENLVSATFSSLVHVLGGLPDGAREGIKKVAQITISVGLLLAVAEIAVSVSPAAGTILHTNWLGRAGELIKESLKPE